MPSRTAALLALALLLAPAAHGQTAYLVRDIDQGEALIPSLPAFVDSLTAVGRKVFFLGRTTANDLWVGASDGTSGGTQLLAEAVSYYGLPIQLYSLRGLSLWVSVDRGITRLWRSDGTRAGTYVLTGPAPDLAAGVNGTALDGRFYFFGCTEADGCGLWATNGTQEGTAAVAPLAIPSFSAPALAAAGHTVYLATDSDLWASDGTAAGTRRVATFPPIGLSQLTAAAGRVFFAIDYHDLWTSDGTAAGTLRVGHTPGSIGQIQAFGDHVDVAVRLGSAGNAQLWRSDGTPAGTVEIAPSFFISLASSYVPYDVAEVGGRTLYYGIDASYHSYLFATDAARGSTVVLKKDVGSLANHSVIRTGERAVFTVDTPATKQVWTTDGTAAGTRRLIDPCAGAPCSVIEPRPLGDGVVFVSHPVAATPAQLVQCSLWRSDGTTPGTVRFASYPCLAYAGSSVAALGGKLLFPAGEVSALWISDGTAAGTHPLSAHLDASAQPRQLLGSGDTVFFVAGPATDPELWSSAGAEASTARLAAASDLAFDNLPVMARTAHGLVASLDRRRLLASDGTPGGTSEMADFGASRIAGLAALGGEAFFPVKTGDRNQLWKSDGTAAGTAEVGELPANVVQPSDWTAVGSTIYFLDKSPGFEPALWATDGTLAGTRRLYTFAGDPVPPQFTRAGSTVYFVADDRLHGGTQVWKTDGTPQGTTLVHAIDGPYDGSQPRDLVELAGNLYFFANMGTFEDERLGLFRSDGTDAGTVLVKEFVEDTGGTFSSRPVALGGTLFFVANDGVHGRELWKSDGTAVGTALVRDISPGEASSQPALPTLAAAGGRLYLTADDGAHGLELWESDGTAAGTRLAQDISPGAPASSPGELTVVGDLLYFAADDGAHGRELWALPLAASGCQPAADHLCLAGGRFRVDADWRDFQGHAGRGTAVALTGDTGYFWFFSPGNVEVVTKVLDGRGVNQAFWVFYGALSSVEYTLSVTDTETGLTRRYFNPSGVLASVGDTDGFGPLGASSTYRPPQHPKTLPTLTLVSGRSDPRAATGHCDAAPGRLCLQGGRFAVTADWKDFQGHVGDGTAVALTGDTGYFWFFDPGNVEVVAKVLDGRTLNGKFWLFYGALSSVEYTLTVTDTQSGTVRMYKNASGHLASVADTSAF